MFRPTIVLLALLGLCAADWELYKKVHGKTYNQAEEVQRRRIFEENVKKISAHNLKHDLGVTTFRMGLNRFTDMTNEEFKAYKGLRYNASAVRTNKVMEDFDGELPAALDWRTKGYVTPVKDQGQCGSCWAFSTTGSLEGQHFKKTGKLVSLSEQNLVDCSGDFGNMGCDGGLMDDAFQYIKKNNGLDTEKSYGYTAEDGQCKFNKKNVGATVTGFVDVKAGSESSLQKAVASVGPISIAIDASNESFQMYSGGVYVEPECSSSSLDHGVLVVGYGTEDGVDYWLVKNSWNESWGEKGYIKMARNKNNQCGVASQASYPTV